ncbi:hypothetical protein ABZS81_13255 [Streptomyces sp. NPDC005318]|uniref:hypothetical protein n=1 Tax=Streptomyces sp. NPDC005318 TaxID=3157031 RepID=UPI0033A29AA0
MGTAGQGTFAFVVPMVIPQENHGELIASAYTALRSWSAWAADAYVGAVASVRPDVLRPLAGCRSIGQRRARLCCAGTTFPSAG